jgi:hypothetical protein
MKNHVKETLGAAAEKAARRAAISRFPTLMAFIGRLSLYEGLGKLLGNVAGAIATDDMSRMYDAIEKELAEIQAKLAEAEKLLTQGGLEDAMASTMSGIAIANPCIKARKCLLVPFKDTGKTAKGNGCCPGQTGHHVLPDAMFKQYEAKPDAAPGSKMKADGKNRACWGKYKHADAPTMCLEGTTNRATNGSHGLAHKATEVAFDDMLGQENMGYEEARNRISRILSKPLGCNPDCIKAQLDDYYKSAHTCGKLEGAQVTPHSGKPNSGPVEGTGIND